MTDMPYSIPLLCRHASLQAQADKLCRQFQLNHITKDYKGWLLNLSETHLHLQHTDSDKELAIHFDQGKNDHRRRFSNGRKQPLSKAVGLDKPRDLQIIDVTAGFGRDAFMLASLGAKLTLVERHPALAALLQDALARAALNVEIKPVIDMMQLVHEDSKHYLETLNDEQRPDVIYMDPMYPERKKSALVKKDMQTAQEIVGADTDADELLQLSLEKALKRVVVKRPKNAACIAGKNPATTVQSKNTRYDIYTKSRLD